MIYHLTLQGLRSVFATTDEHGLKTVTSSEDASMVGVDNDPSEDASMAEVDNDPSEDASMVQDNDPSGKRIWQQVHG